MRYPWRHTLSCAMLVVFVVNMQACNHRAPGTEAPQVHFGEDVCDACGMIVSDDRFACASVYLQDGERIVRLYDDIGEMVQNAEDMAKPDAKIYVNDYNTKQWIDGRTAWYTKSKKLMTPMAFGIAASSSHENAQKLADEYAGAVLDFQALNQ